MSEFLVFVSVREIFGFSEKLLGLGRWCCSTSIHPRDRPASSAEMNFMQCHFTAWVENWRENTKKNTKTMLKLWFKCLHKPVVQVTFRVLMSGTGIIIPHMKQKKMVITKETYKMITLLYLYKNTDKELHKYLALSAAYSKILWLSEQTLEENTEEILILFWGMNSGYKSGTQLWDGLFTSTLWNQQ